MEGLCSRGDLVDFDATATAKTIAPYGAPYFRHVVLPNFIGLHRASSWHQALLICMITHSIPIK